VGIEAPAAPSGVTSEAIALGVAADTGFQTLPRRLSMADQEEFLGVVETRAQRTLGYEAGLLVTGCTEARRTVTVRAGRLAGVSRRRMTGEETGRVIASDGGSGWAVAIETLGPGVTRSA
jgi:hypothetical protein